MRRLVSLCLLASVLCILVTSCKKRETLVERGVNHLILDLRLVKFINSTALGAVIKAHKRCRAEGGGT